MMPQASDELRSLMGEYFGDTIDGFGPIKFLEDSGFTLTRQWTWTKPNATYENLTQKEYECIVFLCHEWDFGGLETNGEKET